MTNDGGTAKERDQKLLERGRLALRAIHYQEQIARYQSQALALKTAMQLAEQGDTLSLERWLMVHGTGVPQPPFESDSLYESNSECEERTSASTIDPTNAFCDTIVESDSMHSTIRIDMSHEVPAPKQHFSWDRMERAARQRQQERNRKREINAAETVIESSAVSSSTPNPPADDESISKPYLWLDGIDIEHLSKPPERKPWAATHVWVSLVLHVLLILGLSIYVVRVVQSKTAVAIVSSVVESDRVLMETPMESESALSEIDSPTESMSVEFPSELSLDLDNPRVTIDADASQKQTPNSMNTAVQSASNRSSALSGSKIGGTEFYGLKAIGNTFVFVVDNSPSMKKDNAFDAAKSEMIRSMTSMKPKQRFHIGLFGDEMEWLTLSSGESERFPVYATPENLAKAMDWLRRISVQKNGKAPNEALSKAIQMQPDGIFLLFDGDTKIDVTKFLRRENRSNDILSSGEPRVPIHVVHFFNDESQKTMMQIAEENGGTYRFVPRPQQVVRGAR